MLPELMNDVIDSAQTPPILRMREKHQRLQRITYGHKWRCCVGTIWKSVDPFGDTPLCFFSSVRCQSLTSPSFCWCFLIRARTKCHPEFESELFIFDLIQTLVRMFTSRDFVRINLGLLLYMGISKRNTALYLFIWLFRQNSEFRISFHFMK